MAQLDKLAATLICQAAQGAAMRNVSDAARPMRMITRTFALLLFVTFALLGFAPARSALADPTLEITTPQGCGPGVMISPTVQLVVRATGIAPGGSVGVHIFESNAFNQKFADSTSLSHDLPERTLTKLAGAPFPPGNVLITAQITGQTDVVSCQVSIAGSGTPTSTAQPTSTPLNASPTPTLTATGSISPTPSVTPTPSTVATNTSVPSPTATRTAAPTSTNSVTVTATPTPGRTATPTPRVAARPDGDANCDGRVTAADPTREFILLSGNERAPCGRDDANHDGVLTPADGALTVSLLFDQWRLRLPWSPSGERALPRPQSRGREGRGLLRNRVAELLTTKSANPKLSYSPRARRLSSWTSSVSLQQPRRNACASAALSRARPMPLPRSSGTTARSWMLRSGRAWNVENPKKQMATPTARASAKASSTNAVG